MNSFSGNLRNLRRAAGCTQKELAETLNVNFTVVSKWERGLTEPGIDMLLRISNIFNVTMDRLCRDRKTLGDAEKAEMCRLKPQLLPNDKRTRLRFYLDCGYSLEIEYDGNIYRFGKGMLKDANTQEVLLDMSDEPLETALATEYNGVTIEDMYFNATGVLVM